MSGRKFLPEMLEVGDEMIFEYYVFKVLGVGKKAWGKIGLAIETRDCFKPVDPRCPGKEEIVVRGTNGGVGYKISAETNKDILEVCFGLHAIYRDGLQIHPFVEQLPLDQNLLEAA